MGRVLKCMEMTLRENREGELCICVNKTKLRLPPLFRDKSDKNDRKKNGTQHYRCQICGKQFQDEYLYCGA